MRRATGFSLAVLLFGVSLITVLCAALGKDLWLDECFGIANLWSASLGDILRGPPGQGSSQPLYYLLEKAWIALWGHAPGRYWDLRLFLRVLPATCWALAATGVYLYGLRFFDRHARVGSAIARHALAFGIAVFYFKNSFARSYAQEARPYSLWLMLSTFQLLLLIELIWGRFARGAWIAFGAVCTLLCLTANVAIVQVVIGLLAVVFAMRWDRRTIWIALLTLTPCLCAFALYAGKIAVFGYRPPTVQDYLRAGSDVLALTLHQSRQEALIALLPLCLVWAPWASRRNRKVLSLCLMSLGTLACTAVLYIQCVRYGFFVTPRQYIFAVPAICWLLGVALWTLTRRIPVPVLAAVLGLYAAAHLSQAAYKARQLWVAHPDSPNALGLRERPECLAPVSMDVGLTLRNNRACRESR